jgi:hypothetical protein
MTLGCNKLTVSPVVELRKPRRNSSVTQAPPANTTSLKNAHAQSCHAKMRPTGQAIVAGTDYDGIEIVRGGGR